MIAYHFVGETLRGGQPIPADGKWLVHGGECVICESGLHASKDPFDALQYAPGATLCMVECEDIVAEQKDKFVCRRRKIIKRFDATEMLWAMSRWSALQVIHLWDAPPVVREYLETGKADLRDAAWAAAWAATRAAARAATWDAAWAATRAAARAATWAATRAATWDAARAAQRTKFAEMVAAEFAKLPGEAP